MMHQGAAAAVVLAFLQVAVRTEGSFDLSEVIGDLEEVPADLDAQSYVTEGHRLRKDGHDYRALSMWNQAARLRPESSLPWSIISQALLDMGRPNDALTVSDHAIAIQPSALAFDSRAHILNKLGRLYEGEKSFRDAIDVEPRNWVPYWNLGNMLDHQGDTEEAYSVLSLMWPVIAANAFQGVTPEVWQTVHHVSLSWALACRMERQHREAFEALALAIVAKPEWPAPYVHLAVMLQDNGAPQPRVSAVQSAAHRWWLMGRQAISDVQRLRSECSHSSPIRSRSAFRPKAATPSHPHPEETRFVATDCSMALWSAGDLDRIYPRAQRELIAPITGVCHPSTVSRLTPLFDGTTPALSSRAMPCA